MSLLNRLAPATRRADLLAAAQRLFGQRPYAEVGIGDIAAAAGASPTLAYHYFGSKQGLYLASLRAASDDLLVRLRTVPELPPTDRLTASLWAYLDYVAEREVGYLALLRGSAEACQREARELQDAVHAELVDGLLEAFEPARRTPELRLVLHGYLGFVESMCATWLARKDVDRAVIVETSRGALLGAVATLPATEEDR